MINQMKSRLAQLETRLKKVAFRHKEIHEECFPKDGSDGVYKEVGSRDWDQHPLNHYLGKSSRVISKIRREMLAILYYIKIMETRQGTNSLILNTSDTINKYRYLFDGYDGKIDLSPLYPKTEEEIKRSNMTRLERMRAFPKEQRYSMFTQNGNLLVNNMMIQLIESVRGEERITKDKFDEMLNVHLNNISNTGHGEVYDTAVREVVLDILEKEVNRAGYNWSMSIEI